MLPLLFDVALAVLLAFICRACRTPGVPCCWYRTAIDDARLSFDQDPFDYPGTLALAIEHGIDGHADRLADYLAGQPIIWGAPAGPKFDNWRDRWQIEALVP